MHDLQRLWLERTTAVEVAGWHADLLKTCEESRIDRHTLGYWTRERLLYHLRGCEGVEGVRNLAPSLKTLNLISRRSEMP